MISTTNAAGMTATNDLRSLWAPSETFGRSPHGASVSNSEVLMRCADVVIAGVTLVFISPVLVMICVAIALFDKGPVFFAHARLGRAGQSFPCLKFRTMVCNADARLKALLDSDPEAQRLWELNHKLDNDPRITWVGQFLRKSSLDELPQLLNVLRGEMSLVGPRPITLAEVPRYGRYYVAYSSVRPGITGLWQVSGRNNVSYRRRVALDTTFVRRRSVGLYFKIIIGTIPAVVTGKGSC